MTTPNRIRVNIRATANMAKVRREKRNGRDVVIVPSATLPDNIVMNGIMYPADEIAKSFMSLNRSPSPAGHPTINNQFVSASDPEGINIGWIGAWNENVRQEAMQDGRQRVMLDKVIDIARANENAQGKLVLEAIDKGEAVDTSTGLYANLEVVNGNDAYESIARDIEFDHDAILLHEAGAARPADGVGMLVNKALDHEGHEITVVNSAINDAENELEWAANTVAQAVEKMARAPLLDRIKAAIFEAVKGSERDTTANHTGADDMADDNTQLTELSDQMKTLADGINGLGEQIANAVTKAIEPMTAHVNEMAASQKAKDEAEAAELTAKVVKANLLDEETAKATPINTLRKLAEKAKPGTAAPIGNGAWASNDAKDEFADVDLNAGMKEAS